MATNGLFVKPLTIAVVGHTNTGKTSLLRTLTRDKSFGQVDNAPGTTRQVHGVACWLDNDVALMWYDTPGLEDSVALRDWVEDPREQPAVRMDGLQKIQRFLDAPLAHSRFEQEARVLSQVLQSDAALYVIDARDPVLAKHRDELALLNYCAKPLIAVLNFTADDGQHVSSNTDQWLEALARLGLHVSVLFDTVSPALNAQRDLFEALGQVLPRHRTLLNDLIDQWVVDCSIRRQRALDLIAELLIDVAALRIVKADETSLVRLQTQTRLREQQCVQALLMIYAFDRHDVLQIPIALEHGRWQTDLFSPQALREMGIELGKGAAKGAAAGAMAGVAIDAMTAGLSLGTGALVGAAVGAGWQGSQKWGKRLIGKLSGQQELSVDDRIIELLALRQLSLMGALERRGHAAQTAVQPCLAHPIEPLIQNASFAQTIRQARVHPDWFGASSMTARALAIKQMAHCLTRYVESCLDSPLR